MQISSPVPVASIFSAVEAVAPFPLLPAQAPDAGQAGEIAPSNPSRGARSDAEWAAASGSPDSGPNTEE